MSEELFSLMQGWATIVTVFVSLAFLMKFLITAADGKVSAAFMSLGGLLLWVLFTLVLVFIVILSGMNHTTVINSGASVYVTVSIHSIAGALILYFLFRTRESTE